MVIILDDESRENEGDLVCAAEAVTPEIINFMASKGKGLICLPMSKRLCDKFDLQMMTNKNRAANKTAFTVSIEAAEGITTGISAADRAHTQSRQQLEKIQRHLILFNQVIFSH